MPTTATAPSRSFAVPSPTRPSSFAPQHAAASDRRRAHATWSPALTETASSMPATRSGRELQRVPSHVSDVRSPVPSAPLRPRPQHHTLPSRRTAQVWDSPTLTSTTSSRPTTAAGTPGQSWCRHPAFRPRAVERLPVDVASLVLREAVSELTDVVVAPAEHGARSCSGARVTCSARDLHRVVNTVDERRGGPWRRTASRRDARVTHSPTPDATIRCDDARLRGAGREGDREERGRGLRDGVAPAGEKK